MLFFKGIITATYLLFLEMAPYLLIGFIFAGILHIFITSERIARHLGKNDLLSIVKASLFGIPLPLCSCGVIPASMTLKREGASQSAIMSFLITTPSTGVDSIFATYALLGPVFTVFRIISSFVTGLLAGLISSFICSDEKIHSMEKESCPSPEIEPEGYVKKFMAVFSYGFGKLLSDIKNSLLLGLLIGGLITYLIPDEFFSSYIGNPYLEMLLMLLAGMPLYICSTGSIPMASALILKGISPGAAFVFLLSGPATNAVTISVIGKELGKKLLAVYIFTIAACSIGFGTIMNVFYSSVSINEVKQIHCAVQSPLIYWIKLISACIIAFFLFLAYFKTWREALASSEKNKGIPLKIENMTCESCLNKITGILKNEFQITGIKYNIHKKTIYIPETQADEKTISALIEKLDKANFKAERIHPVIITSADISP